MNFLSVQSPGTSLTKQVEHEGIRYSIHNTEQSKTCYEPTSQIEKSPINHVQINNLMQQGKIQSRIFKMIWMIYWMVTLQKFIAQNFDVINHWEFITQKRQPFICATIKCKNFLNGVSYLMDTVMDIFFKGK